MSIDYKNKEDNSSEKCSTISLIIFLPGVLGSPGIVNRLPLCTAEPGVLQLVDEVHGDDVDDTAGSV